MVRGDVRDEELGALIQGQGIRSKRTRIVGEFHLKRHACGMGRGQGKAPTYSISALSASSAVLTSVFGLNPNSEVGRPKVAAPPRRRRVGASQLPGGQLRSSGLKEF